MVAMEPAATDEEEFNDWYDTEHVPERRAVPGFESATRMVCLSGWPRYLAFYDLRNHAVITEPGYSSISGTRFSPWSKRILARIQGLWRAHGTQIHADEELLGSFLRLVMIRFAGIQAKQETQLVDSLRRLVVDWPGAPRLKVLCNHAGAEGEYVALVCLSDLAHFTKGCLSQLGEFAQKVDLVNEYAPYWARVSVTGPTKR